MNETNMRTLHRLLQRSTKYLHKSLYF